MSLLKTLFQTFFITGILILGHFVSPVGADSSCEKVSDTCQVAQQNRINQSCYETVARDIIDKNHQFSKNFLRTLSVLDLQILALLNVTFGYNWNWPVENENEMRMVDKEIISVLRDGAAELRYKPKKYDSVNDYTLKKPDLEAVIGICVEMIQIGPGLTPLIFLPESGPPRLIELNRETVYLVSPVDALESGQKIIIYLDSPKPLLEDNYFYQVAAKVAPTRDE